MALSNPVCLLSGVSEFQRNSEIFPAALIFALCAIFLLLKKFISYLIFGYYRDQSFYNLEPELVLLNKL